MALSSDKLKWILESISSNDFKPETLAFLNQKS